jgi:hypothetical protein
MRRRYKRDPGTSPVEKHVGDLVAAYRRGGKAEAQDLYAHIVRQNRLTIAESVILGEKFRKAIGVTSPAKKTAPRVKGRPTFAAAKMTLLRDLADRGWKVTYTLKVNHATSPDRNVTLFFRPQAIYEYTYRGNETLSHAAKEARSLWIDARDISVEQLEKSAGVRSRPRHVTPAEFRGKSKSWFSRTARDASYARLGQQFEKTDAQGRVHRFSVVKVGRSFTDLAHIATWTHQRGWEKGTGDVYPVVSLAHSGLKEVRSRDKRRRRLGDRAKRVSRHDESRK